MAAGINDKFLKVGGEGTITHLASPGKALAATSINVDDASVWPTDTAVSFAMRQVEQDADGNNVTVPNTYTSWRGIVAGNTIGSLQLVSGTDQVYAAGSDVEVFINVSSEIHNSLVNGILVSHDQDGTLKANSVDNTAVIADGIVTTAKLADNAVTSEKMSSTVSFSAYMSADTIGFAVAAYTKVNFNTEDFDYGSNYNTGTQTFTAPVSGVYRFDTAIFVKNSATAIAAFYINGSVRRVDWQITPGAADTYAVGNSRIFKLSAGDTVYVALYIGDSGDVLGGANQWSYFAGHLIGAA